MSSTTQTMGPGAVIPPRPFAERPEKASVTAWIAVLASMIGAFMAILNIQITNASLLDIEGGIGTGVDNGAWVSTSYLIGEIIVIPLTDYMSRVFSFKRYMIANTVLFLCFSAATSPQSKKQPEPEVLKRADAAFREGFAARQAGNLALARSKFAEVVRLQPKIAEGHEALGAVLVELGKPLDGAKEFEVAAAIKPGDEGIETNLALSYFQAGESAKAIPHFDSAISLSQQPRHAAVDASFYDAYGRALASAGKPDAAALQFADEFAHWQLG